MLSQSYIQGDKKMDYKKIGILLPKLFLPTTVRKKVLRSLEQFIQTVKGQNNFW